VDAPPVGAIVLVRFPFSDLSAAKLRPAVVLADAGRDDRVLCQVTSRPYGDVRAVSIDEADLATGTLRKASFARPAKLFTANDTLMAGIVASLRPEATKRVLDAVVAVLRPARATPAAENSNRDSLVGETARCSARSLLSRRWAAVLHHAA
jgi:mRNA interferase MazF